MCLLRSMSDVAAQKTAVQLTIIKKKKKKKICQAPPQKGKNIVLLTTFVLLSRQSGVRTAYKDK